MKPFVKITSKENPIIKLATALQNSGRSRREHGLFVIEGVRLCSDAFENGYNFESLIVSESSFTKYEEVIVNLSKSAEKGYIISDDLFKKISDTKTPQGIMCFCSFPEMQNKILKDGRYIALENLQDPANLGAVSRTAEAFGLNGIIVSGDGCDPYSPRALRASMGALLRIPVIVAEDFTDFLKKSELSLYACVVKGEAVSLSDVDFCDGCAALIGNEGNGLTEAAKAIATPITIKMSGRAESLNAAVAASIVMWKMQR